MTDTPDVARIREAAKQLRTLAATSEEMGAVVDLVAMRYDMTGEQLLGSLARGDERHLDAPPDVCGAIDPRDTSKWCRLKPHQGSPHCSDPDHRHKRKLLAQTYRWLMLAGAAYQVVLAFVFGFMVGSTWYAIQALTIAACLMTMRYQERMLDDYRKKPRYP
jgi:hypothetical protein